MKTTKSAVVAKGDKKKPRINYVEIPADFDTPKIEPGETFEAVAEIRRDKDGYCVVSLDGVPMDKDKERADDSDEPDAETIGAGAKRAATGGDY